MHTGERNATYPNEIGPSEAPTARHGSMPPEQYISPKPQKLIDEALTKALGRASLEDVARNVNTQSRQSYRKRWVTSGGPREFIPVPPLDSSTPASICRTSDEQRPFLPLEEKPTKQIDKMSTERIKKRFHQAGYREQYMEDVLKMAVKGKKRGHDNRKDPEIRSLCLKVCRRHSSPNTSVST